MSKDFSTRSLMITTDQSEDTDPGVLESQHRQHGSEANDQSNEQIDIIDLSQFQIRRRWESSAHPYLFFNPDHHTLTFIGFNIDKRTRNLVDSQTNRILERNIMSPGLWDALIANRVPLQENFNHLTRVEKIERLCRVIGNEFPHDPDTTYELTTDNVKKMMAIYMRFRCNIPVIVMGETGCGKTRLIKFLCALQNPPGVSMTNMVIMKVHGGTTKKHIISRVEDAERKAKENCEEHGNHIITVLFFDEANTTEAIGSIKEIMCDGTIDGRPINLSGNLKLVAACNPYRKHSDEMIARLEEAGLGYHVNVEETKDRLGRIPMRHLVYRVEPLPQSMIPLVWDFGQLDSSVEKLYILQMLTRYIETGKISRTINQTKEVLANILTASQKYMRGLEDECSFVSLRDVERTLNVFAWFYRQDIIFEKMEQIHESSDSDIETDEDEEEFVYFGGEWANKAIERTVRAIILALGVCYHSSLKDRKKYRQYIAKCFTHPLYLQDGPKQIQKEITSCQRVFLENVNLNENVAKNLALRENFFMMVVCVQLRIPLFLVGKPGSSKSLSKSILDHNMQGRESHSKLFRNLKQVQIISFQCSPLATAEGIVKTFQQASRLQENKDLDRFASVVVLDEVGLAEDSPKMPLKALHPLLEDGCLDGEEFEEHKKVAFIGISNWALDPAKMNRGILVQRDVPDEKELIDSARGICSSDKEVYARLEYIIPSLAKGYLQVFRKAINTSELFGTTLKDQLKAREFFGLRDFYSLIKMISGIVSKTNQFPTPSEIAYAIKRNFGGLQGLDSVQEFAEYVPEMQGYQNEENETHSGSGFALLRECLERKNVDRESRYILLLTENYSTLNLLEQLLTNNEDTQILFGSSFPKDQEYIEICRNINRIKVFMETGKTVVLLNLENLYESLYDALNQYYMESGADRFIDLGLGTHRVKCKVDRNFRLIVVAEKRVVYKEFPIPLINRLEKHFLTMEGCLTTTQLQLSEDLNEWVKEFSTYSGNSISPAEVFIGFNQDSCPGVILSAWELCSEKCNTATDDDKFIESVLQTAKNILLWSCTPDAILRLHSTSLSSYKKDYTRKYFEDQCHDDLSGFLKHRENSENLKGKFYQVTTHSKLLSEEDKQDIENDIPGLRGKIALFSLQAFGTEQQFTRHIRKAVGKGFEFLFIQCDTGENNSNLVACARHSVLREIKASENICVIFIVHLSRICKVYFNGFQTGVWKSVHIDDLRRSHLPAISRLFTKTLPELLVESLKTDDKENDKLDMRKLLLDSLHPALASITEDTDSEKSSIDRIRIVFNILEKEQILEKGQFGYGVLKLMSDILISEEGKDSLSDHLSIGHKASTLRNINKCGTLRSSCCKIIEGHVTPVLANILSFLDTNNNLAILDKPFESIWKREIWMKLLYELEPDHVNTQGEPLVKCTGQNNEMKGKFPFSWIVFEHIEQILQSCSENRIGKSAEDLVAQTRFASVINNCIEGRDTIPAMQFYMSDFVNMKCSVTSSTQEQLICECILVNMNSSYVPPDLLTSQLICIHRAYSDLEEAIQIFIDIASVEEESRTKLFECVKSHCEMLDIESVKYQLEKLNRIDALDTPRGQKEWLQLLRRYKPYITRMLSQMADKSSLESPRQRSLVPLRSCWSKIVALKLYIENVAGDEKKEKLVAQGCRFLWRYLGDNANFKTMETVEKFEKFLISSNKKAMKDFLEKFGKCNHCQRLLDSSPPLTLPCGHKICRETCQFLIDDKNNAGKCPECSIEVHENMIELQTAEYEKDQLKIFWDYQKRCNRFFMQVVAQLCFDNCTSPSEEVCKKLLQLVIFQKKIPELNMTIIRTKQLGVFETIVDATPVFRSFLLQLMIRSNKDVVLQIFLEETAGILDDVSGLHIKKLYLLIIQCIEDSLLEELALDAFSAKTENELQFAKNLIQQAIEQLHEEETTMNKIKAIAKARFGLQLTAKYLHCRLFPHEDLSELQTSLYDDLFHSAAELCDLPNDHIRLYLLKYVCRHYGLDLYREIQSSNETWVLPHGCVSAITTLPDESICPDYCLVLGDQYRYIKEQIRDLLVTSDQSKKLKVNDRSLSGQIYFLLSLCKEMKSQALFQADRHEKEQIKTKIRKALGKQRLQFVKENLDKVIDDTLGKECNQFESSSRRSMQEEGIVFLIFHLTFVLRAHEGKGLLKPLHVLAMDPALMKSAFIPTMPEEGLTNEIKSELQRMEELANRRHHKFTWYRCPNGHLYGVGDCGNPTQLGRCYECQAEIGSKIEGQQGNSTLYSGDDQSRPGHILGSPRNRSLEAVSERKLSPIGNSLLRLLTHIAMLIGANEFIEEIAALIRPKIPNDHVPDFLWEHIQMDVNTLRNAFDQSLDGVFMFLHLVIHSLLDHPPSIWHDINLTHIWDTKDGRFRWENEFSKQCFTNVLQSRNEFFNTFQEILASDSGVESDPTLRRVFNLDQTNDDQFVLENPQLCACLWNHRLKVSFEHFVQEFYMLRERTDPKDNIYVVLDAFLRQDCILRYLRCIPSIVSMQAALKQIYGKKITREEANSITIRECIHQCKNKTFSKKVEQGVSSFCELWKCFRKYYDSFEVQAITTDVKTLLERDIDIDVDSLSLLIPDSHGFGVIVGLAVRFMVGKQNDFMKQFEELAHTRSTKLRTLRFEELTSNELITYHHESDLLPIIISNCNYTYSKNDCTTLEYDFDGIQAAIIDQILQGKPVINVNVFNLSNISAYRADVSITKKFTALNSKIPQVQLNSVKKRKIVIEFSDLPEIYEALESLDTVVNFLLSVKCDGEKLLSTFMTDVLQMPQFPNQEVCASCKVHHVQSLWITMISEKTKRLSDSEKDGFESMHENILEPLTEQTQRELWWYFTDLSSEKLIIISQQLLECMIFTLDQGQGDSVSYTYSLKESLSIHLDSPIYVDVDITPLTSDDIDHLPESVLSSHAVAVWKMICRTLHSREQ